MEVIICGLLDCCLNMPININGYNLSESACLTFGASATKVVSANYGIRDPNLPGVLCSATAGGTPYKVYPWPANDSNLNIGSPWNTSTYLFTCPVAGIYYISFGGIVGDGTTVSTYGYFAVIINGANWYFSFKQTDNTWELHHHEILIKLAAGDNVRWAMNLAPGPDGGTAGGYRQNHNMCVIWLLG